MRILFLTVANKSHLYIAAPLAWALRGAGHEVCVASQPDLAESITATGLLGVSVGALGNQQLTDQMNEAEPQDAPGAVVEPDLGRKPTQDDYAADDRAGEFESLVKYLFPVMSPDSVMDDLVAFARQWRPDLVIWDMLTYAGPVAARACGAAHARLVLATDGIGQLRTSYLAGGYGEPSKDELRAWMQSKLDHYGGGEFTEDLALGQWSIDLMPPWTYHPEGVNFVPVRHVPFNGPTMAPDWLFDPPAKPRVCITLGNSHRDAGRVEASASALINAVDGLDIEVIATLSAKQLDVLPRIPDNVRSVEFVPLNELLPSCSVLIHHGGAGTFVGAAASGVPQLIVPSTWWSERWYGPIAMASGLESSGGGVYVCNSDQLTAERLRAELVRVLDDPSFRRRAGELSADVLKMPTPNEIVPVFEELTAQHRAGS